MTLRFDRHCAEIVTQTSLLVDHLTGADVTVTVPTCPGWNVSQLARHVPTRTRCLLYTSDAADE